LFGITNYTFILCKCSIEELNKIIPSKKIYFWHKIPDEPRILTSLMPPWDKYSAYIAYEDVAGDKLEKISARLSKNKSVFYGGKRANEQGAFFSTYKHGQLIFSVEYVAEGSGYTYGRGELFLNGLPPQKIATAIEITKQKQKEWAAERTGTAGISPFESFHINAIEVSTGLPRFDLGGKDITKSEYDYMLKHGFVRGNMKLFNNARLVEKQN